MKTTVPQVVSLTTFSPGPIDEAAQTLTVGVAVDHPEYFDVVGQPTVDSSGTLVYTPAVRCVRHRDGDPDSHRRRRHSERWRRQRVRDVHDHARAATADRRRRRLLGDPVEPTHGRPAHGVLANDADVNSSTLTVTPQTTTSGLLGGTLTLAADGSFTYQPSLLSGQDQFTYTITNGNGDTATGTITSTCHSSRLPVARSTSRRVGSPRRSGPRRCRPGDRSSPVPDLDADGTQVSRSPAATGSRRSRTSRSSRPGPTTQAAQPSRCTAR